MSVLQAPRSTTAGPSRSASRVQPEARRVPTSPRATVATLLLALGAVATVLSVSTFFSQPNGLERHWLAAAAIVLFATGLRVSGSSRPDTSSLR